MIVTQTPLRVSFAGGGSDFPAFYRRFGGAVVSTTIDKYVYIAVNEKFDGSIRVSYSKTEETMSAASVEHPLVRESLRLMGIESGLEIVSIADVPSGGTGLGSSSAFTVGLLHALQVHQGGRTPPDWLAAQSCRVEIDLCGEQIGKQDQYASAFGGLNLIEFEPDDTVAVHPIACSPSCSRQLEASMAVFYTGSRRTGVRIPAEQSANIAQHPAKQKMLQRMVNLALDLRRSLESNDLDPVGDILHENWMLKKELAPEISNSNVDRWYETGIRSGAKGGKLLGAGSGGFLMFVADPESHGEIAASLPELRRVDFCFDSEGSRIALCSGARKDRAGAR